MTTSLGPISSYRNNSVFCLSRWTYAWFQFISSSRFAPFPLTQPFEQFRMRRISKRKAKKRLTGMV